MIDSEARDDPLFQELDDAQFGKLAQIIQPVRFPAGDYVFRAGGAPTATYLIRSGRVSLDARQPGRPTEPVETLGPGDLLGWSWMFPSRRWLFDARVLEAVDTLAFDAGRLRQTMDEDPRLGYTIMKEFVRRLYNRLEHAHIQRLDIYRSEASSS
jgi:CRP-like cAMP-binding protein